ncbi:MAG: heavy-metal-associated domain-containing protein [Paludibacter sp.]
MKTLKFFLTAVLAVVLSTGLMAQMNQAQMAAMKSQPTVTKTPVKVTKTESAAIKTEMIKVDGNCETCKARIEKAAKVDGVTKADWNTKTKMLTMVYNPAKVSSDKVQKMIAAAVHDTPMYKSNTTAYNALPGCCKYR